MSGFSGREFGRGNVAVRHVAVLVGFQWRLPYICAQSLLTISDESAISLSINSAPHNLLTLHQLRSRNVKYRVHVVFEGGSDECAPEVTLRW
jgi:hypothetical protein